eukprot:TRINITY_DN10229_c0_g2_i1.p1 TRINITY_DN10229_c0_g2~~TRINITY_DN10229_c0_g2_i1.p1  ORF type:complete len:217 (-),score=30.85 TRINITY_DN10229_c0_g2_i1:116-727(-)
MVETRVQFERDVLVLRKASLVVLLLAVMFGIFANFTSNMAQYVSSSGLIKHGMWNVCFQPNSGIRTNNTFTMGCGTYATPRTIYITTTDTFTWMKVTEAFHVLYCIFIFGALFATLARQHLNAATLALIGMISSTISTVFFLGRVYVQEQSFRAAITNAAAPANLQYEVQGGFALLMSCTGFSFTALILLVGLWVLAPPGVKR